MVASACTAGGGGRGAPSGEAGERYAERFAPRQGIPEPVEEILAREDWFYGQRMAPADRLPKGARDAALNEARALALAPNGVASPSAAWTNLGPRPIDSADPAYNDAFGGTPPLGWHEVSGRVAALAVHPRNPNVVYMGAAGGGLWKTTNGGGTWSTIGASLDSIAIGAIAVDPSSPRTIYAGTGEASTNGDAYYGSGIYRSTDAGGKWTKVGGDLFDQATVFKILVGGNSSRLLAATNRGLYLSKNQGSTWERTLAPGGDVDLYGNFVTDVVYPSGSAKQVLAAVGWRGLPGGCNPNNGLYLSRDSGKTFSKLNPTGFAVQSNLGRISLAVTPAQKNLIYALVQDCVLMNTPGAATVLNGVYKTTDGPQGPWVKVADTATYSADDNSALRPDKIGPGFQPGIQAWYNQYVEIDPVDPDHVVVGLEEIYDTDDGGLTWDTIGRYWNFCITDLPPNCNLDPDDHPTTHPDQHAAAFGVVNGQPKLYVGGDGGVWSQAAPPTGFDNDSWSDLNQTLSTAQFYYAEASQGPNPTIYGGTQDNGSQKYVGEDRWPVVFGGDGGDVAVEPDNPDHTYEEYVYLIMSKSTNGGQTWTNIDTPDSGSSATARFIAPFDLDPTDDQHVVALGQRVWESDDGINTTSASWQQAYDQGSGHVGTALAVRGETIYTGWCGPCNPTFLDDPAPFARGMASNVGGTWHALAANGLPNRYITSITMDPSDDQHIFVTLSGFSRRWIPDPDPGIGHVFESTDGGENFADISGNLPDGPANDTVLLKGRLIVATDVGIFQRGLGGAWQVLGTGMPAVSTLDLSVVPGGSTVVAATHGRGVWTITL
jgi:hypothetical protein